MSWSKTIEALEKSIQHWQRNFVAENPDDASIRGADCALCRAFADTGSQECYGCPVMNKTGEDNCHDTPYMTAYNAWHNWKDNPTNQEARQVWRTAAKAELDFLKSLLEDME